MWVVIYMDDLLGNGGQSVASETAKAQVARKAQDDADLIIKAKFGPGYELTRYDLVDIMTVGRQVI